MELQQGLNNVIRERVAKRIQTGSMNAKEAVQRLISDGKIANDYIAYLGANNTRKSQVLFDAADAVEMKLDKNGVYTIHDNAIGQLGARLPENMAISQHTYELDTKTQASAIRDLTKSIFSKDSITRKAMEIQGASEMEVDMEKELKSLAKGKLTKDEAKGVEKVLMANKPDDGVTGESTLWKLVQGITAHSRELEPRRQRDLQEIAGDLMNRVKL